MSKVAIEEIKKWSIQDLNLNNSSVSQGLPLLEDSWTFVHNFLSNIIFTLTGSVSGPGSRSVRQSFNLIDWSLIEDLSFHKIRFKSVKNFFEISYRHTNRQTDKQYHSTPSALLAEEIVRHLFLVKSTLLLNSWLYDIFCIICNLHCKVFVVANSVIIIIIIIIIIICLCRHWS